MLGADMACLLAGLVLAVIVYNDGAVDPINAKGLLISMGLAILVFPIASRTLRLHQGRYAIGSADELKSLAIAGGLTALAVLAVVAAAGTPRLLPLGVPPIAAVLSLMLMTGIRFAIRSQREGAVRPRAGQRTLVFGAGNAGEQLIRSMLADPSSP
ncbi:nucleoside-diphosphate sugar epimerase/dehydratase, partial [Blastococcus sp. URHD0036]|uniref:nucleoside-diphosphate sugar epimerase/dehydratase n=1 Tax=Blastococcus sp. URHD0036 TaxID=1380356 RepID=UPI003510B6CF